MECASTAVIVSAHSRWPPGATSGAGRRGSEAAVPAEDGVGGASGMFRAHRAAGRLRCGRPEKPRDPRRRLIRNQRHQEFHNQRPGILDRYPVRQHRARSAPSSISAFIVDTRSPGWSVTRVEDKMDIASAAHSAQISLTDLRVPRTI